MIRLYGASIGHSSFPRVAEGMRWALSELGLLAGFVPIDSYDSEAIYSGHDAEHGVLIGPPSCAPMMTSIGWHKKRWALLPANSTWMPKDLIESMSQYVTGFIAPSVWARDILRKYTDLEVSVWRHGVLPDFRPNATDHAALVSDYKSGRFEVAHLASTTMQRKGTRELVIGWGMAARAGKLGLNPLLRLIVDGPSDAFKKEADESGAADTLIWSLNRWNMDVTQAAHFYRKHHLVCQPSRGEAFGLAPLESLVCGVPVAATQCTGHSAYMLHGGMPYPPPGAIGVRCGHLSSIDDGPDALAPSIQPEWISHALGEAHEHWLELSAAAQRNAPTLSRQWSWVETTKQWLLEQKLGEIK